MKKIFLVFALLVNISFSWSIESFVNKKYYYTSEEGSVIVRHEEIDFGNQTEKGRLLEVNGFGLFDGDNNAYLLFHYTDEEKEFLTLAKNYNGKKYSDWEMPYAVVKSDEYTVCPSLVGMNVIKAESFVTEKEGNADTIDFVPEKFNVTDIPWAVSNKSNNKVIYLNFETNRIPFCKYRMVEELFILNGFLKSDKTYLYKQNARAKEIKITYDDISELYTLNDSGNYQVVKLPKAINPLDETIVKLEIVSYYSGTKYDDVAISGVLYENCYSY